MASAQATTPFPSVVIDQPGPNASVTGLNSVHFIAKTDPAGTDAPLKTSLLFDGVLESGPEFCNLPAGVTTCAEYHLYDVSGLTGPHHLQVVLTTVQGVEVPSPIVTVTAVTPAPTVSILSPLPGADVDGPSVVVSTHGALASSQTEDFPKSMALLVDGLVVAGNDCHAAFGGDCDVDLTWDATNATLGAHTLQAKFTTSHGIVGLSQLVHISLTATRTFTPPSIILTAPSAGATVKGLVNVAAQGLVDAASGDAPLYLNLVVDGQLVVPGVFCPWINAPLSCNLALPWDTTTLSGLHTVAVAFTTEQTQVRTDPITVDVVNPAPTAAVVSPVAAATITGLTTVITSGAIDPAETDTATDLRLLVDGRPYGAVQPCAPGLHTCTGSVPWDTSALTGTHTLQVTFDTARTSVLSPVSQVSIRPAQSQPRLTQLTLVPGPVRLRGSTGQITGVLTDASTHQGVVGVPVSVTFTPVGGSPLTVSATTDGSGAYAANDPVALLGNTRVLATTGPDFGASSAAATMVVRVPILCSVPTTAHHGARIVLACRAKGLANGSVITLRSGHSVASAKVKGGIVRFAFTFGRKGQVVHLGFSTAASSTFAASHSRTYAVRVV